jgi:hypothetical protein
LVRVVVQQWREGQPAIVTRNAFVRQRHAIVERHSRARRREQAARWLPTPGAAEVDAQKGRCFVRQVLLVDHSEADVEEAIRHFLQCSGERMRLTSEGEVSEEDWIALEDQLVDRWKQIFKQLTLVQPIVTLNATGRAILYRTLDHHARLAGAETEERYLTSGTYHRLADKRTVGWHPDFATLLGELGEKE